MPQSVASDTDKIPKSSYEIYRTEGDSLFRSGDYKKAIQSYNQAIELREGDQHCLVARSKCYLHCGDIEHALADAEASLAEDKNYYKGIYQKAEVMYFMADFENALIFYHRGKKLRPKFELFQLGIQKTEEAINNSVGDPSVVTLKSNGDLTHFYQPENKGKKSGYQKPKQEVVKPKQRQKAAVDNRTVKELLGTLYSDREYLEKLLKDEESCRRKTENSEQIRTLAIEGLNYLDSRMEFWQQQKPMYSRKRDRCRGRDGGKDETKSQPVKYVLNNLDQIDERQAAGDFEGALKQAHRVLKRVEEWTDEDLNNKAEVVTNLYSIIGNSSLELGKYDKALEFHKKDLELGRTRCIDEAVSRAMDNLGRVYAKKGDYQQAIDIWEEKLPNTKTTLESTWLNHEIGRCYLELGQFETARKMGEQSLSGAREISDDSWQLNASVLIAQAEVKLEEYQGAIDSFERALDYAKVIGNKHAEEAIKSALDDVNKKIVENVKKEKEEGSDEEKNDKSHTDDHTDNAVHTDSEDHTDRGKHTDDDHTDNEDTASVHKKNESDLENEEAEEEMAEEEVAE